MKVHSQPPSAVEQEWASARSAGQHEGLPSCSRAPRVLGARALEKQGARHYEAPSRALLSVSDAHRDYRKTEKKGPAGGVGLKVLDSHTADVV